MHGDAARVETVRAAGSISMPLIVLAELRAGFAAGKQESANAANLQTFSEQSACVRSGAR